MSQLDLSNTDCPAQNYSIKATCVVVDYASAYLHCVMRRSGSNQKVHQNCWPPLTFIITLCPRQPQLAILLGQMEKELALG